MKIAFVRTVGAKDRIYVVRDDGSESSWSFPSYGDGLPHDLVHLVVECRLGVARGVWGRVAAGADLEQINAQANRTGGKNKYAAMGDELDQVYLAELLANQPWTRDEEAPTPEALLEHVRADAARAGITLPSRVDLQAVASVRGELGGLAERWRALVPRGALHFTVTETGGAQVLCSSV